LYAAEPKLSFDASGHTSTVLAVIPENPSQFAVEGGDAPETLHVTLNFLGKELADDAKEFAKKKAKKVTSRHKPHKAKVSGYGILGSDQPAATVLYLQSNELVAMQQDSANELYGYGYEYTTPHPNYIPHMTLGYGVPLELAAQFHGQEISLNQLAYASDGLAETYMLGEEYEDSPEVGIPWEGPIAFEKTPTGDGRFFEEDSIVWDEADLPMPFRWQRVSAEGHQQSVTIGRVDDIWKDESIVMGRGVILPINEEAYEYLNLLEFGAAGGVSVDGDDWKLAEVIDPTQPLPELQIFTRIRIRGLTAVSTPAFKDAQISLVSSGVDKCETDPEPNMNEPVHATMEPMVGGPLSNVSVDSIKVGDGVGELVANRAEVVGATGTGSTSSITIGIGTKTSANSSIAIGNTNSTISDSAGTYYIPEKRGTLIAAATKSEGDAGNFPASDYAYVPDPDKPSTWKLRLTATPGGPPDARIVGAAIAALGKGFRGNKVQIPAEDLPAVKAKVRAAWKKANPDKEPEDMPDVIKASAEMEALNLKNLSSALKNINDVIDALEAEPPKVASALSNARDTKKAIDKAIDSYPGGSKVIYPVRVVKSPPPSSPPPSMSASIGLDLPPADWFTLSEFNEPTPLTITDDGQVYGHLALWDTCHIGMRDCVTPPTQDDFSFFHLGELKTQEGESVAVGHITFNTGHAAFESDPLTAASHYDNTGSVGADIVASNGSHGIWVSGAIRPGVSDEDLRTLRSAPLSGDWRRIGNQLRLVAALAVNTPGFPVSRTKVLVAGGQPEVLLFSTVPSDVKQAQTEGRQKIKNRIFKSINKEGN
jgi:hypothetical protein